MKKIILIAIISLVGFTSNAQGKGFHLGVELGWAVGESADFVGFTFSLESNYLWQVSGKTFAGIAFGYIQFLDKNPIVLWGGNKPVSPNFMAPALAMSYAVSDLINIGADVGYGVGISPSENKGGFYYKPMVVFNFKETKYMTISYRGITKDGFTFSSITIGGYYSF